MWFIGVTRPGSGQHGISAFHQYNITGNLTQVVNSKISSNQTTPTLTTAYTLDSLDRRVAAARQDGTAWNYGYNDRSEVVDAFRSHQGAPLSGMFRNYTYDNIGNRITAKEGGDFTAANRRNITYTANAQNLYTAITRTTDGTGKARGVNITGTTYPSAHISVNGVSPQRQGPWWRAEIEPAAGEAHVLADVQNGAGSLEATPRVIPSPPANLTQAPGPPNANSNWQIQYDADGNLRCDGWRKFTWDGEQRLLSVTTVFPSDYRTLTTFAYDAQSRRIVKTVSKWELIEPSLQGWAPHNDERFLYDGWNLILRSYWSGSAFVLRDSYVWGSDLSGSLQGAGGVGGLVITHHYEEPPYQNAHFPAYDGNGNLLALFAATTQTNITAAYDYDPFGNTTSATGPMAEKNPFRFSTKYRDGETGLVYYGYRYLDTMWGRWLNRDPAQEQGELNPLSCKCLILKIDFLGLYTLGQAEASLRAKAVTPGIPAVFSPGSNFPLYRPAQYTKRQIFEEWVVLEQAAGSAWQSKLPHCPKCLFNKTAKTFVALEEDIWDDVHEPYNAPKYHPGGKWEIRTRKANSYGAGNQCIYDTDGYLIDTGNGRGTSDRQQATGALGAVWNSLLNDGHIGHDVNPFDLAYELDGNRFGSSVAKYVTHRPSLNNTEF